MTRHLDIETASAYADGELRTSALVEAEEHLSTCAECRGRVRRVRDLVSAAAALPREIAPPGETWDALRTQITRARDVPVPRRRWWHNGWLASAAALVLVAGTAIITSTAPNAKAGKLRPAPAAVLPVSSVVRAVDGNYLTTVAELRATLDAARATLAPSTVRVLEHSIAVCDSAIAEARTALASDPGNSALVELLSAQYELKVELLQRATKLSSSL